MPIWRLQTEISSDSTLPRDGIVMTPHFNDEGVGTDPQGLCEDLAEGVSLWLGKPRQVKVTAYDAEGVKPVYPAGEAVVDAGLAPAFIGPREVAVCLSFYSVRNIPRQRGRLFVPWGAMNISTADLLVRPSAAVRTQIGALAAVFEGLGGVDVDWCIWSRANATAYPVTNWWVDDEWDTIRSRGLRSTTRLEGTTAEA